MKSDSATGILVIPELKSAPYWPVIAGPSGFKQFVKDFRILDSKNVIVKGSKKTSLFNRYKELKFNMIACKIQFH